MTSNAIRIIVLNGPYMYLHTCDPTPREKKGEREEFYARSGCIDIELFGLGDKRNGLASTLGSSYKN